MEYLYYEFSFETNSDIKNIKCFDQDGVFLSDVFVSGLCDNQSLLSELTQTLPAVKNSNKIYSQIAAIDGVDAILKLYPHWKNPSCNHSNQDYSLLHRDNRYDIGSDGAPYLVDSCEDSLCPDTPVIFYLIMLHVAKCSNAAS